MLKITLENVRTFVSPAPVEIRPLTILTGENSSGKSTFLAIVASICDQATFPFAPGFNRAPFSLGTFETIATDKGGELGRAESFSIGYVSDSSSLQVPQAAKATYRNAEGQPDLMRFEVARNGTTVVLDAQYSSSRAYVGTITVMTAGAPDVSTDFAIPRRPGVPSLPTFADIALSAAGFMSVDGDSERQANLLSRIASAGWTFAPRQSTPIAPVRSQPQRIYGQVAETLKPTGDHIPFVIDRLLREQPASPEAASLAKALRRFGEESGLFGTLRVKKLGTNPDDAFQLLVSVAGLDANLVDVGYGVSQALPVIVESVLAPPSSLVLLQQPEIHLHPRGQAAFGTFFAEMVREAGKHFVVETHSDFLIDRVRQEIAAGHLNPDDVALLFFERSGFETEIHRLELDRNGNILNAPATYRSFFLEEEFKLLSR